MADFNYKARNEAGGIVVGKMNADSAADVANRLSSLGYVPTQIKEENKNIYSRDLFSSFKKISLRERIIVTGQLAISINAGITLIRTLDTIAAAAKNPVLEKVLKGLIKELKTGSSFHQALSKYPQVFSGYYVNMVQVGETSGRLGETLEKLAEYMEKQEDFNEKIISALVYPLLLVILASGAIIFILTAIMPKFIAVFKESGIKLPWATFVLLNISNFLSHNYYLIIAAIVVGIIVFRGFIETSYGRLKFDMFKLKMPILGPMFLKIYISRFVSSLALLYNSGITILNSLTVLQDIIGNQVIAGVVKNVRADIKEGRNLTDPLKQSGLFPAEIIMMINAGEESGKLGVMLNKISSFFDKDVEYAVKRMTVLIEPALLIVMGFIVGFMAMAIIIPIFRLRGGTGISG